MGAFGAVEGVTADGDNGAAILVRFGDAKAAEMASQMGRAMGGKLLDVKVV